jgi:hypothetical protein
LIDWGRKGRLKRESSNGREVGFGLSSVGGELGCGLGGVGNGLFAIPFNLVVRGGCCLVSVKCRFGCITTVSDLVWGWKNTRKKKKKTPQISTTNTNK